MSAKHILIDYNSSLAYDESERTNSARPMIKVTTKAEILKKKAALRNERLFSAAAAGSMIACDTLIFAVILINIVAFLLAYLVTSGVKGQNFFRAGFFIPNLIGGIVLGYVWKFVFNRAFVAIASAISKGSVPSPLSTPGGAMFCLILVAVWQYAGYMMLIYVAGFMSVSDTLKEAAMIDGCTPAQAMWNVTIPLMRASFVQCIFLSITRCFVVYDVNLSLTNGEPYGSSVMAAMHVYRQAFTYKNYGLGQAEALILFVICAVVGITQVYIGKKGEVAA